MQGQRRLVRDGDFLKLWIGQTISEVGGQISSLALPLTAVIGLHASPFAVGLLATFQYLPFLLVGLAAGVWVDRLARRPILIIADAGRAVALATIPLAAALGHLVLLQLFIVAFITGVLTVFFDVAYQSYLPSLVASNQLIEGNSLLTVTSSTAEFVGPGLGGLLVGAVTAPIAVAADALSYAVSVTSLLLIRATEIPVDASDRSPVRSEITQGLRYVLSHPVLRLTAASTSICNLFGHVAQTVVILYAVHDLHMSPVGIGVWYSLGSLGGPVAAAFAPRVTRRLGIGPVLIVTMALASVAWFLVVLAPASNPLPLLVSSGVIGSLGVAYNIAQVSMRQAITPHRLQGRMNATMRFLVWGTIPIGALIGGVLGGHIGLHATILVAAIGSCFAVVPLLGGPVRHLRVAPSAPVTPDAAELRARDEHQR